MSKSTLEQDGSMVEGEVHRVLEGGNFGQAIDVDQIDDDFGDTLFALFEDPDDLQLFRFDDIIIQGHKQENGQLLSSTGLTLWPASEWLCEYMKHHPELVCGKHVLELGAGLGLGGIVAHHLMAKVVLLTDGDAEVLEIMKENVDRNRLPNNEVRCAQLIWGSQREPDSDADVIIAADVIYGSEAIAPLWETVSSSLSESVGAVFILSFTRRNVSVDYVLEEATKRGFEWTFISSSTPTDPIGLRFTRRKSK